MNFASDTIFALSSGRPPVAIAVVRVSGPHTQDALRALTGSVPKPRHAALRFVRDGADGEVIDQALVLFFPAPNSETGEDLAELHLHGGHAVIAATVDALRRVEGFRPAEPGEFTRRAFENGKLDLTAVEGLADLIHADTQMQRRQALRHLQGLLGAQAETWRARMIEIQALMEAGIDFADEGDVGESVTAQARERAQVLRDEIAKVLDDAGRGEKLRDGLVVAIAGPPNAGKSTLLNRLAKRDAAIVSPYAGTTRDVIAVHFDLRGVPVTLLDTAGIRDSDDPVEREGIKRARARASGADLVLWVDDAQAPTMPDDAVDAAQADIWRVRNKADITGENDARDADHIISAFTGDGVDALIDALTEFASARIGGSEPALITRARHRDLLTQCVAALDRALAQPPRGAEELMAEDVRLAAAALGRLTGRVDVEEILGAIFAGFCIGK